MAKKLVAADASPLIGLAAADAFELLERLFGRVTVTPEVRDEVLAGGELPGAAELVAAIASGWVEVAGARGDPGRFPELGAGEASTLLIALAHPEDECLVLMDDALGRAQARALGIPVTGLAGVLLAARRARLVRRLRPLFERLERSNFRISNEIVRAVLEAAGEMEPPKRRR